MQAISHDWEKIVSSPLPLFFVDDWSGFFAAEGDEWTIERLEMKDSNEDEKEEDFRFKQECNIMGLDIRFEDF